MVALTREQHDLLARIDRAGALGVPFNDTRAVDAMTLSALNFVSIGGALGNRTVTIDPKGAAFLRRACQ